jgi:hypothetical protein
MLETIGAWVLVLGIVLLLVGWEQLLVAGFRTSLRWGLGLLLFPPAAVVFIPWHWQKARRGAAILGGAALVITGVYTVNALHNRFADLGPRDKIVDGERHLTLTGWDRTDYAVLTTKTDAVVVQMANADVTDETLEYLRGLGRLRELDLNDTQVTDAGLRVLATLPALETLRLRGTKVTDAGFKEHLAPLERLRELDLRETAVTGPTARSWKAARPERKVLR